MDVNITTILGLLNFHKTVMFVEATIGSSYTFVGLGQRMLPESLAYFQTHFVKAWTGPENRGQRLATLFWQPRQGHYIKGYKPLSRR
jgi:hypothetical protein